MKLNENYSKVSAEYETGFRKSQAAFSDPQSKCWVWSLAAAINLVSDKYNCPERAI